MSSLSKPLILTMLTAIILFSFSIYAAGEIDLKQAINIGIENNNELRAARQNIKNLERSLGRHQAGQEWSLDLRGDFSYLSDPPVTGDNSEITVNLSSFREYQGIDINPVLGIYDISPAEIVDIQDYINLSINVSTKLFPRFPTASERAIAQLQDNISVQRGSYREHRNEKLIEWLQDYLSLVRSKRRLEISKEQLKYTRDHYHNIERQAEIGAAGVNDLLNAEIEKKDAEINYREQEQNFTREKKRFSNELGLNEGNELLLCEQQAYVSEWFNLVEDNEIFLNREEMQKKMLENNVNLRVLKQDQKWVLKDLEKIKKEQGPEITGGGDLQVPETEWRLNISLTYNIFDGGLSAFDLKEKEDELDRIERNYRKLERELLNNLKDILFQLDLRKEQRELVKLRLQREEMTSNNKKEKLDRGAITELNYQQQLTSQKAAQIALEEAEDLIMITKFNILNMIGVEKNFEECLRPVF